MSSRRRSGSSYQQAGAEGYAALIQFLKHSRSGKLDPDLRQDDRIRKSGDDCPLGAGTDKGLVEVIIPFK
jgi:hypothetical protein